MIEVVIALVAGICAGVFAGLTPGVPIMMGFMLFLPMISADAFCLSLYGVVMTLGTQFFGSQAVLYYRIPGETSSFPTLIESKNFTTPEQLRYTIQVTTWGSLVATIIALAVLSIALTSGALDWVRLSIEFRGVVFALLLGMCVFGNSQRLSNIVILGLASFFAFYEDIAPLTGFMPTYYFNSMLSLIIIFAMQLVWNSSDRVKTYSVGTHSTFNLSQWLPFYAKYGSIGTIFGLVPQLGATFSSYLTYSWLKKNNASSTHRVAGAETANNGAIVFQWFPLFMFGIPITGSEIMLVSYFNQLGLDFSFLKDWTQVAWLAGLIALAGLIYTRICLTTNQLLYKVVGRALSSRYLTIAIAFGSMYLFYWVGNYTAKFMLIHLMIFIPVSWIVAKLKVNLLAVTIGMILMSEILLTFYQLLQIHIL